MTTGNVKKYTKSKGYESLNRNMLQDVENLSLDAIGLLSNLTSYPSDWTVHKTELYKRYTKSGRRKVERAWNELVEERYIVQLRRRKGKTYEYIYYHSQERFTEEEIKEIEAVEGCPVWDGKISNKKKEDTPSDVPSEDSSTVHFAQSNSEEPWTVQNEQSKLDSTKRTDKKLTTNQVYHQESSLDTLDTRDTKMPDQPPLVYEEASQEKERLKEQYMNEGFYANTEKVPPNLSHLLKVFSETPDEAETYYNVILRAKKDAEIHLDEIIWLEHEPELEQKIIQTFSRAIRKIEKGQNVENQEGYIYRSLFNMIVEFVTMQMRPSHYSDNKKLKEILSDSYSEQQF